MGVSASRLEPEVQYTWRRDWRRQGNAQDVGEALENCKRKGVIDLDVAVKEAKSVKNPMHPYLNWNDKTAAHAHRKEQLRSVIRSIRVIQPDLDEDEGYQPPAFVVRKAGFGYESTRDVLSNPFSKAQVCSRMAEDLQSFKRRWQDFAEYAGVSKSIKEALKSLDSIEE